MKFRYVDSSVPNVEDCARMDSHSIEVGATGMDEAVVCLNDSPGKPRRDRIVPSAAGGKGRTIVARRGRGRGARRCRYRGGYRAGIPSSNESFAERGEFPSCW